MSVFDSNKHEWYDRLLKQELDMSRYVRDIIAKNDDTKKVYDVLCKLLQAAESRTLLDMGEGKHPDGRRYEESDFREKVGEVSGLRWLPSKITSMVRKADDADAEERKKE